MADMVGEASQGSPKSGFDIGRDSGRVSAKDRGRYSESRVLRGDQSSIPVA